mgnify:CR=1 FL=1
MNEIVRLSMLLEIYKDLITEKQKNVLNLYYNQDLSLAEIADEYGISRQAARDNIKNGEKNLLDYESKLGLLDKRIRSSNIFDEINLELSKNEANKEVIKKLNNKLKEIMEE